MQPDKLIAGLERFFYDVVGSLIPGVLLLTGLWLILSPSWIAVPESAAGWWIFVAAAYVVGSGMATLGERTLVRLAGAMGSRLGGGKGVFMTDEDLDQVLAARETLRMLAAEELGELQPAAKHASQLRNVAMSLIPADDRATVVRFMWSSPGLVDTPRLMREEVSADGTNEEEIPGGVQTPDG